MNITAETLDIILPSNTARISQGNLTLGQIDQIQDAVSNWMIALHWVVKIDFDKKHKIPASRNTAKALQPLGEYQYQIFLLCAAIHARQRFLSFALPYNDAYEWFILICKEKIHEIQHDVKNPHKPKHSTEITYKGDEKRKMIRKCLDYPALVEKGENPFRENHLIPHLNALLDAAIELSKNAPEFKNRYLTPYTKAWRAALREMESSRWQRQFLKNGQLHRMKSGSKATTNITAKKNCEAEKLVSKGFQRLPANSL